MGNANGEVKTDSPGKRPPGEYARGRVDVMDDETALHHLEELAGGLDIELRYEAAAGRAGLCVLRGRKTAVIDESLRVAERAEALAMILADEPIEDVYLPPAVRERIVACRERKKAEANPPTAE